MNDVEKELAEFTEWYESVSEAEQLAATQIVDSLILEEQSDG